MGLVNSNIRHLRKSRRLTQEELANALELKRSAIGAYEEGRAEPRLTTVISMAKFFGVTVDEMISEDLAKPKPEPNYKKYERPQKESASSVDVEGKQLRVLSITLDQLGGENIELVPDKAAAGYLSGFHDPEYLNDLPRFQLPMLPQGTYRAFEISGDSMLPLTSGTTVICEYVENWKTIKGGLPYVLVTESEGIVFKRVFNHIEQGNKLTLFSDNTLYAPYDVDVQEVREIWRATAFLSMDFPDAEITLTKLASMVMDLQAEVIRLKGRAKA